MKISEVTGGVAKPRIGRGKNSVAARDDLIKLQ
jgi:hypothetical protein